jgi:IS30 family transposase
MTPQFALKAQHLIISNFKRSFQMGGRYKHINLAEREKIYELSHHSKFSIRKIAKVLGRSPSSISRELNRNRDPSEGYQCSRANKKAESRQVKKGSIKIKLTNAIETFIRDMLKSFKISPMFICRLIQEKFSVKIHHETIYRFLIRDKKQSGKAYQDLPRYRKYKRRLKKRHSKDAYSDEKDRIDKRPKSCSNGTKTGHLEMDLIVGSGSNVLLTLVDMKTKFTVIERSPSKTMQDVRNAIHRGLKAFKYSIKTITTDNGTEFLNYKEIEKEESLKYYFTNPYHSWEKGLIENTNALIRRYIKKGSNFDTLNEDVIKAIETLINITPRKSINMKSSYILVNRVRQNKRGAVIFKILDDIKSVFNKNLFKASIGWV